MCNIKTVFWELCMWHKSFFYVLTKLLDLVLALLLHLQALSYLIGLPTSNSRKCTLWCQMLLNPNVIDLPHWKCLMYVQVHEFFKEWQNLLAFILDENGGLRDQNIIVTFYLWCAKTSGGTRVSWLCEKHYEEQMSFSLS